jgi:hypothetical protein
MSGQIARRIRRYVIPLGLLALFGAAPASAQSEHLLGAGVGVSVSQLNGGSWERSMDWFIFRLPRPEHLGISWDIGSETFGVPAAATPEGAVGSLRVRHFLIGPGYTYRVRRLEITVSALAGLTANKFVVNESKAPSGVTLSSKSGWGGQIGLTSWIDLAPQWGLKLSTDYLVSRPQLISNINGTKTVSFAKTVAGARATLPTGGRTRFAGPDRRLPGGRLARTHRGHLERSGARFDRSRHAARRS